MLHRRPRRCRRHYSLSTIDQFVFAIWSGFAKGLRFFGANLMYCFVKAGPKSVSRDGTVGKNFIIDQIIKVFGNCQTAVSDYIRHCALRFGRQPEKMLGQGGTIKNSVF